MESQMKEVNKVKMKFLIHSSRVYYRKGKIQANTQIYHIIVNKEDDLICFHYFKTKISTANDIVTS